MQLAKPRLGRIGDFGKLRTVGDVQLQGLHAVPASQFSGGGIEVVLPDIGDRHVHPRAQQGLGNPQPDSRSTPGDERGLAFQILHVTLHLHGISRWPFCICYLQIAK